MSAPAADRPSRLPALAGWLLAPVLVLACAIAFIAWSTRGVGAAAEAIIADWKAGADDAFFERHAAPVFAGATNATDLALLAQLTGLADAELDWTGRGYEGPFGHATLALVHSDRRVPMTLLLERIGQDWKLRGITVAAVAPPLAEDRDATAALLPAASASLLRTLALAARTGSLAPLHAETSLLLQSNVSIAQLEESFRTFLEPASDITALVGRLPVIEHVSLEKDDLIARGRGHYAIGDGRVDFDLSWVREGAGLRPIDLHVTVRPASANPPPPSAASAAVPTGG